ncbi:carotenoid isomerooxygenase isoform X2 [Venturia canescens]|uniref:carotenoid isomerooxygenase isoform X2 n=1 Tax=Venturia canescens TaxID=32260 RepID=UPI001C9BDB59|nr:carotenoid isomerooxygenase isoform X2 [Venturia canescens]
MSAANFQTDRIEDKLLRAPFLSSIARLFPPENDEDSKEKDENCNDDSINYWPNCDTSIWMRSSENEVVLPITGKITGFIPKWLRGTLLRNGPGSLKVGEYRFDHLFDSSALLHRFEISDGSVTYQRRFVQTDVYKRNHEAKRIVVTEFGTKAVPDPCQSIFHSVAAVFNPIENLSDNSMISVYPFGDEYYTFAESPVVHRIDPKTLETLNKVNLNEYVGIINHTSHPHVMNDGTVYNMGMSITSKGPAYNIVRFSPSRLEIDDSGEARELSMFDQATIVATVPSRWIFNPSYMHTFGITENYFIIVEQPLAVALVKMLACQLKNEPMCSCLKWHENENTLIHIISRDTGNLERTFIAEGFFYLHIINQFETRDRDYVVLDICCYRDAKMLDCMYVDVMKNMHKNPDYSKLFRGRPLRFVLPMKQPTSDIPTEHNLVRARTVNQSLEIFENLENRDDFERADSPADRHTTITKSSENFEATDKENVLARRATAHRLPDGNVFVKPELLCDLGCETPRLNYDSYLGREYRYFYAISSDVDIENPGTLIKVDTVTKTRKIWHEKGLYPSEPIFVPDPNGKNEDEGVVLSAAVWGQERETEVALLILDAVSMKEIGRASFVTPGPVPKCLHGWFSFDN